VNKIGNTLWVDSETNLILQQQ